MQSAPNIHIAKRLSLRHMGFSRGELDNCILMEPRRIIVWIRWELDNDKLLHVPLSKAVFDEVYRRMKGRRQATLSGTNPGWLGGGVNSRTQKVGGLAAATKFDQKNTRAGAIITPDTSGHSILWRRAFACE